VKHLPTILLLAISSPLCAQQSTTGNATATGGCSIANTGSNVTINVRNDLTCEKNVDQYKNQVAEFIEKQTKDAKDKADLQAALIKANALLLQFTEAKNKLDPKALLARYPLGYVVFGLDSRNDVFPYQSQTLLEKYDVDWTGVGIVKPQCPIPGIPDAMECGPNQISLRLPNIGIKGGPMVLTNITTGGTRRVGPLGGAVVNDLEMNSYILDIRAEGIVFLIGFNQSRRF
jgi:hypothetical protein